MTQIDKLPSLTAIVLLTVGLLLSVYSFTYSLIRLREIHKWRGNIEFPHKEGKTSRRNRWARAMYGRHWPRKQLAYQRLERESDIRSSISEDDIVSFFLSVDRKKRIADHQAKLSADRKTQIPEDHCDCRFWGVPWKSKRTTHTIFDGFDKFLASPASELELLRIKGRILKALLEAGPPESLSSIAEEIDSHGTVECIIAIENERPTESEGELSGTIINATAMDGEPLISIGGIGVTREHLWLTLARVEVCLLGQ